jgi:predicted  nucleic acid-binding Zn-ribbon protein
MVRENCDNCDTSIDAGEESYCEGCYSSLQKELEIAKDEIDRLREEIADHDIEIDKLKGELAEVSNG